MSDRVFLLLDGYNLAFRSFYAVPHLSRSDGLPTNALHGWVKTIWRLVDLYPSSTIIAFFDLDGDKKRQELHPEYKANRSEMPDDLVQQMPLIQELTPLLGIEVVALSGVEADDLIASAAQKIDQNGDTAIIVSADKDLAQCVTNRTKQLLPPPTANPRLGWRTLEEADVKEKFGVRPDQIADYLALIGDTSDNIPGIAGVGPKTAANWLRTYGNLENVILNCGRLKPPRFQSIINDEKERLRKNQQLTQLNRNLSTSLSEIAPDKEALLAFLQKMEMSTSAQEAAKRY